MTALEIALVGVSVLVGIFLGARLVASVINQERAQRSRADDPRSELQRLVEILNVLHPGPVRNGSKRKGKRRK